DVQRPQNTQTAYVRFEEGKTRVIGFTGCNRFSGKYKLSGQKLTMSNLSSSRMACPEIDQENKMLDLLGQVDSYRVAGDLLTLYAGETAVATFRAGNEQEELNLRRNGAIIID
ncbi:META domain-containing protein, partial [Corynebacterium sp.]|uniref:META domain-containing protein n=1 Tax=Corynebacterium sp. TaxID=1720 RepID=UPI002F41B778